MNPIDPTGGLGPEHFIHVYLLMGLEMPLFTTLYAFPLMAFGFYGL